MPSHPYKQSFRNEVGKVKPFQPVTSKRSKKIPILASRREINRHWNSKGLLFLQREWIQCARDGHARAFLGGYNAEKSHWEVDCELSSQTLIANAKSPQIFAF